MAARSRKKKKAGVFASLYSLLSLTFIGRLVLYLVAAALVGTFDWLVSGNRYDVFYQLVGAEFLLFAVTLWIVYVVRRVRE